MTVLLSRQDPFPGFCEFRNPPRPAFYICLLLDLYPTATGKYKKHLPVGVPSILSLMVRSAAFLMSALMYVGWDESTNMVPNAIGLSTNLFDNLIA
jgi:hypothetical protein